MLQSFSSDPAERRKIARLVLSRQPRARRRKIPKQRKPTTLELNYYSAIRGVLQRAKALVDRYLVSRLPELTIASKIDALRLDAGPRDVGRIMTLVNGEFRAEVSDARIDAIADRQAKAVTEFGRDQFEKQMRAGTGSSVPLQDPPNILRINEAFAAENDAYIKSIPMRYFDEVQKLVLSGISNQTRWEEIAKQVEGRYGVAESSAKLIARDQTGKLLGAQTQARQQALGLTSYIWRTSDDERVREEHAEREGEVFQWSDPPEDGHPGQPIQCRCSAEPVLDELLD